MITVSSIAARSTTIMSTMMPAILAALLALTACQAEPQGSVCDDIKRDIAKLEAKADRTIGDDYVLSALIRERSERNCE